MGMGMETGKGTANLIEVGSGVDWLVWLIVWKHVLDFLI